MQPIFLRELAENDWVDFNGFHILAAHQETHILKPLERIGKYFPADYTPAQQADLIEKLLKGWAQQNGKKNSNQVL